VIVSRILHAGYIFSSGGVRIAFDPVFEVPFSTNCYPFPAVSFAPEALAESSPLHSYDAVFISHFHDDHCSLVSLDKIPRSVPIYLYCVHEELFDFIRALGFTVHSLSVDEAVNVGPFVVTPRLALDPDVDSVFEICAEGLSVLNVVDAWIDPSVLTLRASWDLVLWPFQTMRELEVLMPFRTDAESGAGADADTVDVSKLPPEWLEQLHALHARFVVPSSCQIRFEEWSWYNHAFFPITYAEFASSVANSRRMNPGESFELTPSGFSRIGRLEWIAPVGPQDVDYEFVDFDSSTPDLTPPSIASIARHFPALNLEQRALVDRFCEGLDVTLYDHDGIACGSGSTEAIAYKVYRAVTAGEQITSMYLRTHDIDSDELISKLSQDPVAFQRAQLRRLNSAL